MQLLRVVARRLRRTNTMLADLIFVDVPGRVAKQLLQLAQRFGSIDGGQLRGFDSIEGITSDGTTLLQYYRRCMRDERTYENAIP